MMRALRMFAVSVVATAAIVTAGWAQPQAVISWGANTACTNPPVPVTNMNFTTASAYPMYIAVKNVADPNVASDIKLLYGGGGAGIPDAWRFDDLGCQTGSQIGIAQSGSKACPVMKGPAPLPITNVFYDATGGPNGTPRVQVRLSIAYDTFTPVVTQTYTLWNVTFDHSFSNIGPTPGDNSTCGGAEVPMCISIPSPGDVTNESFILTAANTHEDFTFANPTDQYLTWNSVAGCPGIVPTQPSTWGHLKGLYR